VKPKKANQEVNYIRQKVSKNGVGSYQGKKEVQGNGGVVRVLGRVLIDTESGRRITEGATKQLRIVGGGRIGREGGEDGEIWIRFKTVKN